MHSEDCDTDDPIESAEGLIAQGRAKEAVALLQQRLDEGRGGLLAHLTLVRALIAAEDTDAALALARETALSNPHAAAAALALGDVFAQREELPLAIAEFQRALRIDPDLRAPRLALGRAWLAAGEPLRAFDAIAPLEAEGHPEVRALAERARAMRTLPRSDAGYVRHLFDQFSSDYDVRMRGELAYAAPEILKSLADLVMPHAQALSILDLGCGTGLAGVAFKPIAAQLDGIDLSPKMLERARKLGIYDRLWAADIEAAPANAESYDLAIAADTFAYLGDLSTALRKIAVCLKRSGFLLFTVEKGDGPSFSLGEKRRWKHSEDYIRAEGERAGLTISGLLSCMPRTEAGKPVEGLAVALQKSG